MKLKFTAASRKEKAQTINTSQLEGFNFRHGQEYRITFLNGETALAYVNRENASTLYIRATDFPSGLKRAVVGSPVSRTIKNIKKLK